MNTRVFLRGVLCALALTLFVPRLALGTASVLQTGHAETASGVATFTVTPTGLTAGSLVEVCSELNRNNTVSSVSGSVNGSYTVTGADADDGTARRLSCWRKENVAAGSEIITFTYNSSTSAPGIAWVEVGGVKTSSALDIAASGRAQTTPTTGTDLVVSNAATSTAQPAIIISFSGAVFANGPAAGTGFTSAALVDWGGTGPGGQVRIESKRITATGSQTSTFTATSNVTHLTTMAVFDELTVTNPTFTSAPAFSSRTTSSIVDASTASETGTYYGVLVTSGSGAPSCTQVKAGQDSTSSFAYAANSVAETATVSANLTFGSLTSGTVKDGYFCVHGTVSNLDSTVSSILNQYKTPAFSVAPSVTARSTTSYTVGQTLDGAGSVALVTCKTPDTAPTGTQVKAGQCTGNVTATSSATKSTTGADTETLSGLDTTIRPIYTVYEVGTYGSIDSAVTAIASQLLSAPAGQQYIVAAALPWPGGANSVFANISPAVVNGDVWQAPLVASPSPSNYAITQGTDGTFQIATAGDQSRQSFVSNVYDVSVDAWSGTFTSYVNDQSPVCTGLPSSPGGAPGVTTTQTGVALTPIDWNTFFTDAENDALTISLSPSSLNSIPLNLGLSSGVLSGSIAAAGTSLLTFRATDIAAEHTDCAAWSISAFTTVTVPSVVGQSFSAASSTLTGLQLTVPAEQQIYRCRRKTAYDQILNQTPSAGAVVNPFTTMQLTVAKACAFFNAPVVQ
jgi:hypothetical protein